ncbi:hypothetical protein GPECTOR_126g515 [Gonium pectorale]|uniref:Right handed beta helix domain-containing protein n=1 Tax=Gonium pectorale TaxID=33097 RepID=A0A150FYJ3_GONPE|nr:hypothetical protein GPECTOR_126g515 [Gonium pectorale]|eukprot:KXZ42659.1 hypothetical protein GPECTOR_126g515 [Gonium pectorale]
MAVVHLEVGPELNRTIALTAGDGISYNISIIVSDGRGNGSYSARWAHFGLAFVGIDLRLVDSTIQGVPLSATGPLLACWGCPALAFRNVTLRGFAPKDEPAGINEPLVYGAATATGVAAADVEDFSCTGVTGASHWACLQLGFQIGAASVSFNRSSIENNTVSSSSGAGALVFTSAQAPQGGGSSALTVRITNSSLVGNTGGSGSALYSSVPLLELDINQSTISGHRSTARGSSGSGGAVHIQGNSSAVRLHGTKMENNTAECGSGGAMYVYGTVGNLTINGSSTVSGNSAGDSGGAIYVHWYVNSLTVNGSSNISGNSAGDSGGAMYVNDKVYTLTIDGSSNISGNSADGGSGT